MFWYWYVFIAGLVIVLLLSAYWLLLEDWVKALIRRHRRG